MERLINDCPAPSCEWEPTDPEKLEEENRYIPAEHVEDMMKFDIVSSIFKEPMKHPKDFHEISTK